MTNNQNSATDSALSEIISQVKQAKEKDLYLEICGNWYNVFMIEEKNKQVAIELTCYDNRKNLLDMIPISPEKWREKISPDGTGLFIRIANVGFIPVSTPTEIIEIIKKELRPHKLA